MKGSFDLQTGGWGMGPAPNQPNAFGGIDSQMKVCVRYLTGDCPMLDGQCPLTHPISPMECTRWMQYFNRTPCKYGDTCYSTKCLFDHPNRKGYTGCKPVVAGTSL
mmetsp:Transcript_97212/g.225365  ORF Transcript_97212/g.225365 Transcript_97212/m.225365 type:complete len:106 (-) Transcript_97212:49-366(-)